MPRPNAQSRRSFPLLVTTTILVALLLAAGGIAMVRAMAKTPAQAQATSTAAQTTASTTKGPATGTPQTENPPATTTDKPQAGTHVTYKFTNPPVPDVDYANTLPESVKKLKPTDDKVYQKGAEVKPKALVPEGQPADVTDASIHYVRVTNKDAQGKEHKGIWTFKGWDKQEATADGETDITFTGTWQYGEEEWSGHLLKLENGKIVEGTPDGTVPFAFVDSRYYDGTESANPFNLGFKMGNGNPYWTNGDWYHPEAVYRSDDYFYDETGSYRKDYADFNQNGQVSEEKPQGYPLNDVGATATGTLVTVETDKNGNAKPDTAQPSYNAGIYTWVQWGGSTITPFGRSVVNNYDFSGLAGQTATWPTYMQVWKVNPIVSLTLDKTDETVQRGDTVTATFTIENTYDNMEGLPTADQVSFVATYATDAAGTNTLQPSSKAQKNGNVYTQSFVVPEDTNVTSITITATTSGDATNYNEGSASQTLKLPTLYKVRYKFKSDSSRELPDAVTSLLPTDDKSYANGTEITPASPTKTTVKVDGGTWKFQGWKPAKQTINKADVTFVGTWTFETPAPPVTPTKEYWAHYKFVNGSDDNLAADSASLQAAGSLPDEVMALLPEDQGPYSDGTRVYAKTLGITSVTTKDGDRWIFKGWDEASKVINGADVTFVGTWIRTSEPSTPMTPVTPPVTSPTTPPVTSPTTPSTQPATSPTTPPTTSPSTNPGGNPDTATTDETPGGTQQDNGGTHQKPSSNKQLPQTGDNSNTLGNAAFALAVSGIVSVIAGIFAFRTHKN